MIHKRYIAVVQCHIVKERCSGYLCERAFTERTGLFEQYKDNENIRFLSLTCGGCCGRATDRKLSNLLSQIEKKEGVKKDEIVVHFSSCLSFESKHGPVCPHKEYLEDIVGKKLELDFVHGSRLSKLTEKRRAEGIYKPR